MSDTLTKNSAIAASQTDARIRIAFATSELLSLKLLASKGLTLKTNSPGVNAIKSIASSGSPGSGTFTATVTGPDGTTTATTAAIAYNATAAVLQAALRLLTTVGTEGVTCTGGPVGTSPILATFAGPLAAQPVTISFDSSGLNQGSVAATNSTTGVAPDNTIYLIANRALEWRAGVDQVWTVTLTGTPASGTFKLVYRGQVTSTIAYNASAATVQAALEALSTIGSGNVAVTGSAGGPWTVTAALTLAGQALYPLYAATNALGGGTNPSVTVAIATQGRSYMTKPFSTDVTSFYVTTGTDATTLQSTIVTT